MSVPRSVSEVLASHVSLEVEGIDRMYLNVYVPQLQRDTGVVGFFRYHQGYQFVSSALMDPISKRFIAAMDAFAKQEQIPVVQFRKGQRKDDVAAEHLSRFDKTEGVLFIGKAQERRRCSGPSGDATTRPALRIRGWCDQPPWSTTSTFIAWTAISDRSF